MKCPSCGAPRDAADRFCAYCRTRFEPSAAATERPVVHVHYHQQTHPEPQVRVERVYVPQERRSSRSRLAALLLCLFFGVLGVHKFYLGRVGMGFVYLFTYGLFGIGWLVDLVVLLCGNPRDRQGLPLKWQ